MTYIVRRLVSRVGRSRSAVQDFARAINGLSRDGLRWWKLDGGGKDGGLDASGKSRVLDDTESSLVNVV